MNLGRHQINCWFESIHLIPHSKVCYSDSIVIVTNKMNVYNNPANDY